MKIAVLGLWHLGTVTAASLAAEGHDVVAVDDAPVVAELEAQRLPVDEPGLAELIADERARGRLTFAAGAGAARGAELIWIAFDTPVSDDDRPDVESVVERSAEFLAAFEGEAVVVVSSQLPVGSVARLERRFPGPRFTFAAVPENLRLGSAIAYFRAPDRFVAGVRDERARAAIERAIGGFAATIVWMSVESAEMTKHAINAFLATSVTFANELASVCERVGADAREVERGLKSDVRIGPKAYVRAGEAFAGGTLARDLAFLAALGDREGLALAQLRATAASNARHRDWTCERVEEECGGVASRRIAVLGLVYKPGTNTLRASTAVALARRLRERGAEVLAYDPAIPAGDPRAADAARTVGSAAEALAGADCAVVATAWPEFRDLPASVFEAMRERRVVDPARFLEDRLAGIAGLRYVAFGRGAPPRSLA
jgi:UDPglucose 6-dehydrogenase